MIKIEITPEEMLEIEETFISAVTRAVKVIEQKFNQVLSKYDDSIKITPEGIAQIEEYVVSFLLGMLKDNSQKLRFNYDGRLT